MQHVKTGLRKGEDVTTALYDAGFSSPSRLYENANQQLGMTPGTYRRGGAGVTITFAIAPTPLGRMLVAATERGLCAVRFGESATELERGLREEFHAAELHRDDAAMGAYIEPLLASLRGENTIIDLPLDVRATAFQKKVWETLRQIPRGETRSYTDVAREIGDPKRSAQWLALARPIQLRWRCHVIAWCAATETWRDIAGEWSGRRSFWKAKRILLIAVHHSWRMTAALYRGSHPAFPF